MGIVVSTNWAQKRCILTNTKTGAAVRVGDKFVTSRNEQVEVTGGKAPHKSSSTGRVWCNILVGEHGTEFDNPPHAEWFPSVIDCEWVEA